MKRLRFLLLAIFATFITTLPAIGADRILFYFGPLNFSVAVDSLETFAKEGKVNKELAFYLNRLSPPQQAQFRKFLQSRFEVNPRTIYRFAQSSVGEKLLQDVGEFINIPKNQNGFYGVRGSLIQAVMASKSINAIELMRKFPTDMQLNTENIMDFVGEMSTIVDKTKTLVAQLDRMTVVQTKSQLPVDSTVDIKKAGDIKTSMQTIALYDSKRDSPRGSGKAEWAKPTLRERNITIDLYLPESTQTQTPIIIISNGIGAGRDRFDDLALHLASHGFAVVIPDHPGSDHQRQQDFYAGLYKDNFDATEFRDRPLDVTFILDELEKRNQSEFQNRLNLQQVGVFGYSFGGATALSLAGGTLDYPQLEKDCTTQTRLLNISLYYQCRALEVPRQDVSLQDPRIKAIYLFVPFSNSLFGKTGMSGVNIPTMWQAAAEDIITPLISEQMPGFEDLVTADKYFAVSQGLPHAWILLPLLQGMTNKEISKEEATAIARDYQNILTVAFFKTYLSQEQEYRSYLDASYFKAIAKEPFSLSLVRSLPSLTVTSDQ
jgi:predicted dienelactone hydrolase